MPKSHHPITWGDTSMTPGKFKPRRDRRVPHNNVACTHPDCLAPVGEDCRSSTGGKTIHRERRRRAIREGF